MQGRDCADKVETIELVSVRWGVRASIMLIGQEGHEMEGRGRGREKKGSREGKEARGKGRGWVSPPHENPGYTVLNMTMKHG